MRAVGKFADPDELSQMLLRFTVTRTVYCLSQMSSPWGSRSLRTLVRPSTS